MTDHRQFLGCDIYDDGLGYDATLSEMMALLSCLRPKPSAHALIRIGGDEDGSYLVPDDLEGIKACFSPGVNNFKNFEDHMVKHYGMNCHMCDFSSDVGKFRTPLIAEKQTFLKKWLDTKEDASSVRLDHWLEREEPDGELILQMDIEGAEYRNILAVDDDVLRRFRVIVLEVHKLGDIVDGAVLRQVLMPFFGKLSKIFDVVHAHPNNCCGEHGIPGTNISMPSVLELTYLRKDRNASPVFLPMIPHPLDITKNRDSKPPMFLGEGWINEPRPAKSQVRMLEIQMAHLVDLANAERSIAADREDMLMRSIDTLNDHLACNDCTVADSKNVALGKRYYLSSSFKGSKVGLVEPSEPYFFHTKEAPGQYIMIDLEQDFSISGVTITNRVGGRPDRARGLFIVISPNKRLSDGKVILVPDNDAFLTGECNTMEISVPNIQGRCIFVRSPDETALHFSNIEIFASA